MHWLLIVFMPLILYAKPFKVATYNVENLFDINTNGTEYDNYIPHTHNWNRRTLEIKLNHISEVICDIDADIIGLQEVENKNVLQLLSKKLRTVGCAYRYSAITNKIGAPIQVALLSRYPLVQKKDIVVSRTPKIRNILEVEVSIKGVLLTIFVNHWKSKAYKGVESKRLIYARALQSRIATLPKKVEYIIIGDLNSDYNVYLTLDKKLNDTKGLTAFNDILHTKVGTHLVDEFEIMDAKQGVHYSLWNELELSRRWSHKFYGHRSTLDHIVLPSKLFDGKGVDYVNNSFRVFRAPYLFTKKGYLNRWRYKKNRHRGKGYSDHLPIYAYFDTKPYQKDKRKRVYKEVQNRDIDYLYETEVIKEQIKLKNVIVLLKRGNSAVVKQKNAKRGIYLFSCASRLKEGYSYDLLVESIKTYHGLKEVVNAYVLKERGAISLLPYYLNPNRIKRDTLKQNEVLKDIVGIYKNKMFLTNGKKLPIYFKKKKLIPKNGSRLKLYYAHVGYYNKLQLVIYSKKDFKILE